MQNGIKCDINILISFVNNNSQRDTTASRIIERAKQENLFVEHFYSIPSVGDTVGIQMPDRNGIDFWAKVVNVVVYPSSGNCESIAILDVVPLCMLSCTHLD